MTTQTTGQPRPAIDPRIKERRIEVQRRQGRRRLRVLLALLAVVAVVCAAALVTRSPLLDVDHVTVVGAQHVAPRDIVRVAGLDRKPLMVDVDSGAVARAIERLSWVATARVARRWPATVAVTIVERTPAAAVPAPNGQFALVDVTGRVLALQAGAPAGLLQVVGGPPAGAPATTIGAVGLDGLRVAAAIPPELRGRVSAIAVAATGVELHLAPSGVARLGDSTNLAAKLDAVVTVLQRANTTGLAVLDVRVPSAPVLTRA